MTMNDVGQILRREYLEYLRVTSIICLKIIMPIHYLNTCGLLVNTNINKPC